MLFGYRQPFRASARAEGKDHLKRRSSFPSALPYSLAGATHRGVLSLFGREAEKFHMGVSRYFTHPKGEFHFGAS